MLSMQLSFLELPAAEKTKEAVLTSSFDWKKKLRVLSQPTVQTDLVSVTMPQSIVEVYKSGSSAITDLKGYIQVKDNIGICATDASGPVLALIAKYVSEGGKAFIDSGAFRHFKKTLKNPETPPLDFDKVMASYQRVIHDCSSTDGLIVVAPDIVGKQEESYQLLCEYRDIIMSQYEQGVSIMVPLQKGALSLTAHYQRCRNLLGFDFVCGIPSNAKAISSSEIMQFLEDIEPKNVHFLGTCETGLVHRAKYKSPNTSFSCDATMIRKQIGKGSLLTEMQSQITDEAVSLCLHGREHKRVNDEKQWDETEVLGDITAFIDSLTKSQIKQLARALNINAKELVPFDSNDALWRKLDEVNYGYAEHIISDFLYELCRKSVSPKVRLSVVSELASLDII